MKNTKYHKPLYAKIASGEYDSQWVPARKMTSKIPYSKGVSTQGVEIFALSNEVAYAAQVLTNAPENAIPTNLLSLRLPYPKVVFEMPISPEVLALRLKQNPVVLTPDLAHPTTVGVYAEELPEGGISLQSYWEAGEVVEVSPIIFVINATEHTTSSEFYITPLKFLFKNRPDFSVDSHVLLSPVWKSALTEEELERLRGSLTDQTILDKIIRESLDELPSAMFSALMLLNCKSGITAARVSERRAPSGYGKRLKSKHSSPAYTVLALSEVETVSSTGIVTRRPDLSAHYVRGHFKARKSGVYWWSSFIRGSGTPRKREAYIVKT